MRVLAGALLCLALFAPAVRAQTPTWVVTLAPSTPYASMAEDAEALPELPANSVLQLVRSVGDWSLVQNPRTGANVYIDSSVLAPGGPPSRYLTMPAPPMLEEFSTRGVVTDGTSLSLYPSPSEEAIDRPIPANTWLNLTGAVEGEDGELWYRTEDGDYLNSGAVFAPERSDEYAGGWLDVDLSVPAHVTVYEGSQPVKSFLTIKGTGSRATPSGVFTILRRVANETMNSDTIGIPRFGPGGYYLTNVLFTQYFTGDGASLHYNYWSSNFGYAGSHGCLGLTYGDRAYLWDWAHLGTPVVIHY
ncbi:MAG TPA: L,D-transpeptidase [Chloroflexota bacterium]|nr:L,D-transpeptidase [Chloroflexota bacterium]